VQKIPAAAFFQPPLAAAASRHPHFWRVLEHLAEQFQFVYVSVNPRRKKFFLHHSSGLTLQSFARRFFFTVSASQLAFTPVAAAQPAMNSGEVL